MTLSEINPYTTLPRRLDQAAGAVMAVCGADGASMLTTRLHAGYPGRLIPTAEQLEEVLLEAVIDNEAMYPMGGYAGGLDAYLADMIEAHCLLAERGFVHLNERGVWASRATFDLTRSIESAMYERGEIIVPSGTSNLHRGNWSKTVRAQRVKTTRARGNSWIGNHTITGRHGILSFSPGVLHWAGTGGYWRNAPLDGRLLDALLAQTLAQGSPRIAA